jgi:hypothetical protein
LASAKFLSILIFLLTNLIITQSFGQMIDINKKYLAKSLGRFWVSDLSVGNTGKIGFTIFCKEENNLYFLDTFVALKNENPYFKIKMRPGKSVELYTIDKYGKNFIAGAISEIISCKTLLELRDFNTTLLRIYSIDGKTKLSAFFKKPTENAHHGSPVR